MYLGIDGGGTKTEMFLFNGILETQVRLEAGGSHVPSLGMGKSLENIREGIEGVLAKAQGSIESIDRALFALSGAFRQKERITAMLQEEYPTLKLEVLSDGEFLLENALDACDIVSVHSNVHSSIHSSGSEREATQGEATQNEKNEEKSDRSFSENCILYIAGTGSVLMAKNSKGEIQKLGGNGHLIDDYGSAYDIAMSLIRAMIQEKERYALYCEPFIKEKKEIEHKIKEKLNVLSAEKLEEALVLWIYSQSRSEIALQAKWILNQGFEGKNGFIQEILEAKREHLLRDIETFRNMLGFRKYHVLLFGGLILGHAKYREYLEKGMKKLTGLQSIGTINIEKAFQEAFRRRINNKATSQK